VSHFERAVEIEPQSADSLYNLGVALEGLGRRDEAVARFTVAAGIDPRHAAAQRLAELGVEPVP
jgi:Flp pilus assembly protein TadD